MGPGDSCKGRAGLQGSLFALPDNPYPNILVSTVSGSTPTPRSGSFREHRLNPPPSTENPRNKRFLGLDRPFLDLVSQTPRPRGRGRPLFAEVWEFPHLVVSKHLVVCDFYAEARFCALLRPFVPFCALFADLRLCSFALIPDPPTLAFFDFLASFRFSLLFCAFFLPFPRILGVPRREALAFSGVSLAFFPKRQGLEGHRFVLFCTHLRVSANDRAWELQISGLPPAAANR